MSDARRIDLLDPAEVARLGGIEIVAQGVVEGFLAGIHRSPFRGFSVEFTEHRAYQPGDEPRYLDWKMLARSDRLVDTPDGRGTAAEPALRHLLGLLARRGLVVLVSDLLFDRDLALTALRYLRHRGHQVIVLHVMDPAELELAGPPEVRFRDPESAASVVVRPRELAGAYAATVRREIAGWRAACRRHGVAYHHIRTDMPFGMALRLLA